MAEMIDLKKERNFFETRVIEYPDGRSAELGLRVCRAAERGRAAFHLTQGAACPDPFMAVDAGRRALEDRRVYRPHHFLLLREHFLRELVAARGTRANRWPCIRSTLARPCASAPS